MVITRDIKRFKYIWSCPLLSLWRSIPVALPTLSSLQTSQTIQLTFNSKQWDLHPLAWPRLLPQSPFSLPPRLLMLLVLQEATSSQPSTATQTMILQGQRPLIIVVGVITLPEVNIFSHFSPNVDYLLFSSTSQKENAEWIFHMKNRYWNLCQPSYVCQCSWRIHLLRNHLLSLFEKISPFRGFLRSV